MVLPFLLVWLFANCAEDSIRIKKVNMKQVRGHKIRTLVFTDKKLENLEGVTKDSVSLMFIIDPENQNINKYNIDESKGKNVNYLDFGLRHKQFGEEYPLPKLLGKRNNLWVYEFFMPLSYQRGKREGIPTLKTKPEVTIFEMFGPFWMGQSYDLSKGNHKILFHMIGPKMWGIEYLDSNTFIYKYEAE